MDQKWRFLSSIIIETKIKDIMIPNRVLNYQEVQELFNDEN